MRASLPPPGPSTNKRMRVPPMLWLVLTTAWVASPACGSTNAGVAPDAFDAAVSNTADAGATNGLGELCGLGCVGSLSCAATNSTCETGICTFDGMDAYCTVSCESAQCPSDYACRDTEAFEGAPSRVCVFEPGPTTDVATVALVLHTDIDNSPIDFGISGDFAILQPTSTPLPCDNVFQLTATAYSNYIRRADMLRPCAELDPRLRDLYVTATIPIPLDSTTQSFSDLRWQVSGNFASSQNNSNNGWMYAADVVISPESVEQVGDKIRVSGSVDFVASLRACAAPDGEGCALLAPTMRVSGTFVWLVDL